MYAKFYFERFWEGDQKNHLFVCMPFHDSFDSRFRDIIEPSAKQAGFDEAIRIKGDISSDVIISKIWDGIANSMMILIDLTDDPKYPESPHVNGNVLYEAGAAHAMREPSSIVMIRDQSPESADFDIKGLTINQPPSSQLSQPWLIKIFPDARENHKWQESKRVNAAAESIDDIGLGLMLRHGKRPAGWNHFNTMSQNELEKISVLRLIDLGVLRFATGGVHRPAEYAYHWTKFGYEVMRNLGIQRMSEEEFRGSPDFPAAVAARQQYVESIKKSP